MVADGTWVGSSIGPVPTCVVGTGPIPVVCARWCPTLPHPGGCSTIGAVRLSFRVRDGYRAFPCRCDHRDDYVGSACVCSSWRVSQYLVVGWPPSATHTRWVLVCVVGGWVGCGPYSGRLAHAYCAHPPLSPTHAVGVCGVRVGGVVVCVGLLVPVSSQTVAGLPLLAYQPSSLLGAYQEHRGVLVETLS